MPDFGLDFFGKLLSGGGWLLIWAVLLILFFPPVGILLNKLLGWVMALVPGGKLLG